MRIGTLALILGAAGCAAAAAFLTKSWLANSAQPPARVVVERQVEKPDLRTVIVAAKPLSFGSKLTADALRVTQWPAGSVPEGTFASVQSLLAGDGDRLVLSAIARNEPILASKITAPGERASLSVVIGEGKTAVTIRVDDVLGVAGFVQPDDRVNVLLTRSGRDAASSGEGTAYTDVLLQDVRVLAIDQLADRNAQAKPARAVTVEVDTADAQKLVLAAAIGQLSLALRRAGGAEVAPTRRISTEDLLRNRPKQAAPSQQPVVTVTRATDRKQYEVQSGAENEFFAARPLEPVPSYGDEAPSEAAQDGEPGAAAGGRAADSAAGAANGNANGGGGNVSPGDADGDDMLSLGAAFGTARADIKPPPMVSPRPIGPE